MKSYTMGASLLPGRCENFTAANASIKRCFYFGSISLDEVASGELPSSNQSRSDIRSLSRDIDLTSKMNQIKKIIAKYRKESEDFVNTSFLDTDNTIRQGILESIFKPKFKLPEGKGPFTHPHPNLDKLHLPPHQTLSDWRKYQVEDHPALMAHQKRCHAAGLHDPWARNYAFYFYNSHYFKRTRIAIITQGLAWGFLIGGTVYVCEKIYDHFYPTVYKHTPEYIAKYGTGERHH